MALSIMEVKDEKQLFSVKNLFLEYARSLDFNLDFQDFHKELAGLPGEYSFPGGALLLALQGEEPAGCVALRKMTDTICEMKRLYVKPLYRGDKIGKILAERIITKGKELGYQFMRLDTVPSMRQALGLYKTLGFTEIKPYRYNPIKGAIFMELKLQ